MDYTLKRTLASRSDRRHFLPALPLADQHRQLYSNNQLGNPSLNTTNCSHPDFRSLYLSGNIRAVSAPRNNDNIGSSLQKFRLYGDLKYTRTKICDHRPTEAQMKPKSRPPTEKKSHAAPTILPDVVAPKPPVNKRKKQSKLLVPQEHSRSRRPSLIREQIAPNLQQSGEPQMLTKKNISYKYFFLPKLTSKYVSG